MLRRDFVRVLLSAMFSSRLLRGQQAGNPAPPVPAPVPWTLGLNPGTPLPHTTVAEGIADAATRFFTPRQLATLARLSDVLVPAVNGKPGALEAQTPQFLDFLIGSSPARRKKLYSEGLDWLDAESVRRYKLPFAKLDTEQAGALIEPWLRSWMSDHPPAEPHAEFINVAHEEIRAATVNSKAWSEAPSTAGEESTAVALYWWPIEPTGHEAVGSGCAPMAPGALGAPKGGNAMPVYPR
jgi:hypothetical protein